MAERKYKSFRNHVSVMQGEESLVVKTFQEEAAFQREWQVYRLLQQKLPCARVIRAQDRTLVLSRLPGENLVDHLEAQERTGVPQWDVWNKLAAWLIRFHQLTGFPMQDVNLRNFLYDETTQTLYGLDFEECEAGSMEVCAAQVAAFVRLYRPENTPMKQKISQYILALFAQNLQMEVEDLYLESVRQEEKLLQRRKQK